MKLILITIFTIQITLQEFLINNPITNIKEENKAEEERQSIVIPDETKPIEKDFLSDPLTLHTWNKDDRPIVHNFPGFALPTLPDVPGLPAVISRSPLHALHAVPVHPGVFIPSEKKSIEKTDLEGEEKNCQDDKEIGKIERGEEIMVPNSNEKEIEERADVQEFIVTKSNEKEKKSSNKKDEKKSEKIQEEKNCNRIEVKEEKKLNKKKDEKNLINKTCQCSKTNSIKDQLGSLYSKIFNKEDIIDRNNSRRFHRRYYQKCQIRTGRKKTHFKWNGNHPFVNGSTGLRELWYYVPFKRVFRFGKPNVEIALSGLDVNKDRNLRIRSKVMWKSREGFVLKISTWANTKLYFADVSYFAHLGCN